jgi:hypothetical protein
MPDVPQMATNTIVLNIPIPKVNDFTAYLPNSAELDPHFASLVHQAALSQKLKVPHAFDCEAAVAGPDGTPAPGQPRRIHACRCFRGKYWSLTIRQKSEKGLVDMPVTPAVPAETGFTPAGYSPREGFLNSIQEICDKLDPLIFPKNRGAVSGMVVVTGATACGKTQVVRGLIDRCLRNEKNRGIWSERKRLPHVVTYEDPIEKDLIDAPFADLAGSWVDYTPRLRAVDVLNLPSAVNSALRQTPAVFYVGEVRDIAEWRVLLEFAGTGHLIFTTSHAGSLIEAMGKLFAATSSQTAARRAIVADRLAALIHLRADKAALPNATGNNLQENVPAGETNKKGDQPFVRNIVIPSLWRRTMLGAKTLMAEGQSSLLPHGGAGAVESCGPPVGGQPSPSPQPEDGSDAQSCLGRTWFGDELWKCAESRLKDELSDCCDSSDAAELLDKFHREFRQRCVEWDLEGL